MAECIERETAILTLLDKGQRSKRYHLGDVWELNFDEIKEAIASIPAADVRPAKHGKWIDGKCNQCGANAPFWPMATTYYESLYCPNCGAKMERVVNDV